MKTNRTDEYSQKEKQKHNKRMRNTGINDEYSQKQNNIKRMKTTNNSEA